MNTKKKFFVASLLCVSVLGIAGASAFVISKGTGSTSGTVDNAVYLNWGDKSKLVDITTLTDTNPVYQTVSVSAPAASVASGYTATFKIHLAAGTEEKSSLAGVTVAVADKEWGKDTTEIGHAEIGTDYSLGITAAKIFYLKYTVTSEEYAKYVAGTQIMAGTATFTYDAVAA